VAERPARARPQARWRADRTRDRRDAVAIGQPWIDLATLGAVPARARLLGMLLDHLVPALDRFETEGLGAFRARWDAHDALAGRPVALLSGADRIDGEALGIADDGGLRVRVGAGERVFHSADVSLRAP
jgi:BirA family transcriptional regulator, biotin operon repressor / biotin---[acetyl-CoA-carboxylase] ligase